jgi:EAL and modified HD-GYP domain-containing signal transduction protein
MVSIVKVDFRATSQRQQREIAWDLKKYRRMALLAEKVETQEEFEWAAKLGYRLFQGYFFEKPVTLHKQRGFQVRTSYVRLLRELNRPGGADLGICAQVIRSDAALTYEIIRQVQKLYYYRGNLITDITLALVVMGVDEVRRWALLVMARDNNVTCSDELLRRSYLRGAFAKRLMRRCAKREDPENGFLLGMFSMLDQVMGMDMETLLAEVELPRPITKALLGKADSIYSRLLEYIIIYETGDRDLELPDIGVSISDREAAQLYMDSLLETDRAFTNILGK